MYNLLIEKETLDKWMDVIEGNGKWKEFSTSCPKVRRTDYGAMAQLFENVEKMMENTVSADGTADYSPVLISMIRRIMPALIGPQVFGTQPMNAPTGLALVQRAVFQNDSVNSVNRANSVILTLADASAFTAGTAISSTADAGVGVVRHKEGNNILVQVTSGAFVVGVDVDDAATFSAAVTTVSAVYENEALFEVIFSNYSGSYTTAAGEALSTDMKEVGLRLDKVEVAAKTRKLKSKWSNELEEDVKNLWNIDVESLLSSIATDEIIMEMNREFINLIQTKATNTSAYDYSTADGRWEAEKYQNLTSAIGRSKRAIATKSKRGQGTYMIVSPAVLNALETSGRLKDENVDPIQQVYAGKAMGMDVFVDIYATDDTVYVGYKGPSEMDAGIFYCPYIPLQIRKGYGEEDGQPRAFFSTRYGLLDNPFGASNYYHSLTVANLPS